MRPARESCARAPTVQLSGLAVGGGSFRLTGVGDENEPRFELTV
jgi:hypothetical protein